MTRTLAVMAIVEGHGEVDSVPILLRRIGGEILHDTHIQAPKPIRVPRGRMLQKEHLGKAINLAVLKLANLQADGSAILVLLDADDDPPCTLGPQVQATAREVRADADVFCVVAHVEYETWFVAAAESLMAGGELQLDEGEELPTDPEGKRFGKSWVRRHMRHRPARYSETIDQAKLTHKIDLHTCRSRARSFDKLCRELEAAAQRVQSDA